MTKEEKYWFDHLVSVLKDLHYEQGGKFFGCGLQIESHNFEDYGAWGYNIFERWGDCTIAKMAYDDYICHQVLTPEEWAEEMWTQIWDYIKKKLRH